MTFEVRAHGNDHVYDIYADGQLFTTCNYSDDYKRPFMGPVYTKDGAQFTRFAPFHKEHPHQRSLFVGIGNVNGVDFWNQNKPEKGVILFSELLRAEGGETANVTVKNSWIDPIAEKPLLNEIRSLTFSEATTGIRVDVHIELHADYGEVRLGRTKEAGPLGIRVADYMRADGTGTLVNSEGGNGEPECWGKKALWCTYSGEEYGTRFGISVFDRKTNAGFPTVWHVRAYGLFAANNLLFEDGPVIPQGDKLDYDYTVVFWRDSIDESEYSETL